MDILGWVLLFEEICKSYNIDWIAVLGSYGIFMVGIATLILSLILAFRSQQAQLAKFERKEKLREKRYKHYTRLDDGIFTPLSTKYASAPRYPGQNPFIELFSKLELEYDLGSIPELRFYKKALQHLEIDYRDLDYENDVKSLKEEIREFNKDVRDLRDETEKNVENSLRVHAEIAKKFPIPPDSILLTYILEILGTYWRETLNEYKKGEKSLEEILSEMEPFKMRFRKKLEGQYISYGGYAIMGLGLQKKENEIISTMDKPKENGELIKKLIELEKIRKELIAKSKEIAEKFEELSDKIDSEEYETEAPCCPKEE